MKAELKDDGFIYITAETAAEAFAIRHIMPTMSNDSCGHCGRQDLPFVINSSTPSELEAQSQ